MPKNLFKQKMKMLSVFLVFYWCPFNCDVHFKITNRLKINNDNLKFNDDFKATSQLLNDTIKILKNT